MTLPHARLTVHREPPARRHRLRSIVFQEVVRALMSRGDAELAATTAAMAIARKVSDREPELRPGKCEQ